MLRLLAIGLALSLVAARPFDSQNESLFPDQPSLEAWADADYTPEALADRVKEVPAMPAAASCFAARFAGAPAASRLHDLPSTIGCPASCCSCLAPLPSQP